MEERDKWTSLERHQTFLALRIRSYHVNLAIPPNDYRPWDEVHSSSCFSDMYRIVVSAARFTIIKSALALKHGGERSPPPISKPLIGSV